MRQTGSQEQKKDTFKEGVVNLDTANRLKEVRTEEDHSVGQLGGLLMTLRRAV